MIQLIAVTFLMAAVSAVPSDYPNHLQHITIPDYHPMLQFLGQHVDLPHIPTKVVRITKTVAIKVPVPYPVKVPHHVPYPVPVNKPYPVPVTKIVKVPEPVPVPIHSGGGHGGSSVGYGAASGHGYGDSQQGYAGDYNNQGNFDTGSYQGYGGVSDNHGGYLESQQYSESNHVNTPVAYSGSSDYDHSQGAAVQHQASAAPSGSAGYYQNYQVQDASGLQTH